mmetsp:Transcript_31127/g.48727  ORF Transcript_31127/g.48727 Transcript_31127/m.48727 type:complete len:240 (-) Transcript_31127:236-955(-)|eukprot:CAMPEP_0201740722 /NCGR_PEP_ID=MMETSP0593-20130828/46450_1 /ASSEMBLY_ACC=CAM_ASM_000672 /TAXON_ID=267983 /ORGANISM="Skeletonema japonicum, Strain CCMP2506" /LENGTH=239 /DNA_ID=CAMNT_0048235043 /DNA_START=81 /DNA_END=800 /DNA_ORIENTATION=+
MKKRLSKLIISSSCSFTSVASVLNIALITGSTRTAGPPTVPGPRVNTFIQTTLENRGHTITHIDPKQFALLQKPAFGYASGRAPQELQECQSILQQADAYVCVTPEYNHSPSPALMNVLNHFGSSVFSFKPSAIVTYSAGQWGGTRAGVALRTTLSELGCLPVSAMIHIPKAQEVLDRDGSIIVTSEENDEVERWQKYCSRTFSQLEWWAVAACNHREVVDPFDESPVFGKAPSQRNAP